MQGCSTFNAVLGCSFLHSVAPSARFTRSAYAATTRSTLWYFARQVQQCAFPMIIQPRANCRTSHWHSGQCVQKSMNVCQSASALSPPKNLRQGFARFRADNLRFDLFIVLDVTALFFAMSPALCCTLADFTSRTLHSRLARLRSSRQQIISRVSLWLKFSPRRARCNERISAALKRDKRSICY